MTINKRFSAETPCISSPSAEAQQCETGPLPLPRPLRSQILDERTANIEEIELNSKLVRASSFLSSFNNSRTEPPATATAKAPRSAMAASATVAIHAMTRDDRAAASHTCDAQDSNKKQRLEQRIPIPNTHLQVWKHDSETRPLY